MKIQCNACETAEANVLCCADEAALCWGCDEKIHAANKLAGKHQRVPLSNSNSQMPKCDICQEMTGYFFCLEDRALFCRKCDVAIHTANSYVSRHQRFLLTGVKVGLEPIEPVVPSAKEKVNSKKRTEETPSKSLSKRGPTMSLSNENNKVFSNQGGGIGVLPVNKVSFSGCTMTGIIPDWPLDEFLGLTDFSQNYGFMEQGSSKADSGKLGDSESSLIYPAADEELDGEECMGQVPEISWMVPEIPSPPTASGLYWPRNFRNPPTDKSAAYVPDITSFSLPTLDRYQPNLANLKRRRQS